MSYYNEYFDKIIENICNLIDDELFETLSSGQMESIYILLEKFKGDIRAN